jgi:selenocysteine-specific elongation factor
MKHLIVGTAGHIDHGKSALVKALTGIDPDRLKEEKERGLTIDLGFAHMELPDGTLVSFVDVPGHERFVKNMLAGAAGMDIVILVIDATESIMPQTREHFDIMRLLGISRGIIAITKVDIADEEMIEIVEAEIEDLVKDTFLESAPVVRVSSKTGEGLDEIRKFIGEAVEQQKQKDERGLFRFPIDRVFTMKGFGTVVTGTVFSGSLTEDEAVQVLPSGLTSRARQLQSHNRKQETISAGMRAALNLAGVAVEELKRGDTIVKPGTAAVTNVFDAHVKLLSSAPRKLSRTSTVKVYAATNQQVARMLLYGQSELKPGEESYGQFRCQNPICMFRGDHFVIRAESPEITIGGGIVLDVAPQRTRLKKREKKDWLTELYSASPAEAALAFLSKEEAAILLRELAVRLGKTLEWVQDLVSKYEENGKILSFSAGDEILLIAQSRFDFVKERALRELGDFFKAQPHRLFMPREQLRNRLGDNFDVQLFERILDNLLQQKELTIGREGISLAGRSAGLTEAQKAIKEKAENLYRDTGYSPPTLSQAEEQLGDPKTAKQMISLLIEEGTLQRISPALAYHREFLDSVLEKTKEHFQANERLSVGDLKTVLGVSRKHAVPLLEYFDKIGLTVRVGDYRISKKHVKK